MKLNNLGIDRNLTQNDFVNINVGFQLEHQIINQETKDCGWRFDKSNSMTKFFRQTSGMIGSNYVKNPSRYSALLKNKNDDNYCSLRSILAILHPSINSHPNRLSNYRQYFNELNIDGFDFSNGFRFSDAQNFEKLNNLSVNIFELGFHQDQLNGNIN